MNRLATRLAAAMIATTVLSLVILVASLQFAEVRNYRALPSEVRAQIPPPRLDFFRGPPPREGRERPAGDARPRADTFREQALGFEARRQVQEQVLLVSIILAAGVTTLLALLLSRSIARPIKAVSRAAGGLPLEISAPACRSPPDNSARASRLTAWPSPYNRMSEALETYEHERRAMVADIAHELRTPLTALQMRLEAI